MSHTPLPWKQEYLGGSSTILAPSKPNHNGNFPAYGYDEKRGYCIAVPFFDETIGNLARTDFVNFTHEDAAFIVKAVNAHDDLVAVLQDIVAADGMRPGHVAYKSRADIAAMAREALAKAGAL